MGAMVTRLALPFLTLLTLMAAVALIRHCHLPAALARLSARRSNFLIVGAGLLCGCSFVIDNVIYRGMFFLLVLPGLATLTDQMTTPRGRRVFGAALIAIPFVTWRRFFDLCLTAASHWVETPYQGTGPYEAFPRFTAHYLLWFAAELAWWWIIAVLLAVLGAFVLRSDVGAWLCRMPRFPALARRT